MKTLMRNGRDRRSENPRSATRGKNACLWLGPISGSHQGQQPNGCTQRPDTWLHPNDSRKPQILFPCTAGAVHTWHLATTADQTFCPLLAKADAASPTHLLDNRESPAWCGEFEVPIMWCKADSPSKFEHRNFLDYLVGE